EDISGLIGRTVIGHEQDQVCVRLNGDRFRLLTKKRRAVFGAHITVCAAPMLMCGIRVATSLLAGMCSLSRREGVTRSWMNCPLDKSATAAKPWRSQTFGVALDIDQAPCVRRDPHLSHRR
ncbi:MAG TPA: hypothetical protein VLN61_01450, partial [Pseudolabrys sp.]|nr:hypothetical protein [Pseudolabrys sp.]